VGSLSSLKLSCGLTHIIIIDVNHNVWTYESNIEGKLGLDS